MLVPSRRDQICLGAWYALLAAISFAATWALVQRATSHPHRPLGGHFLIEWAAVAGGALLAVAVVGGVVVLSRDAPWRVALSWPLLAGPAVAVGCFVAVVPQMQGGSVLCDAPADQSCDTAWGFGAAAVAVAVTAPLALSFLAAFAVRRLFVTGDARTA